MSNFAIGIESYNVCFVNWYVAGGEYGFLVGLLWLVDNFMDDYDYVAI